MCQNGQYLAQAKGVFRRYSKYAFMELTVHLRIVWFRYCLDEYYRESGLLIKHVKSCCLGPFRIPSRKDPDQQSDPKSTSEFNYFPDT